MKKSIFVLAFLCTLFTGCQKADDTQETGEDLSYLIMTYQRYESNGHIYKTTWTYDGYKPMGYQHYMDGELTAEGKNYSYVGLHASYDYYQYYNDSITTYQHVEWESLDETFQRTKYTKRRYYYPDHPQDNYIYETYYEYDGKKKLGYKSYRDGLPSVENHYDYSGLRCTYKTTYYYASSDAVEMELSYDITYLDDSYLRTKSYLRTRKRYDINGNLTSSDTYYYIYDYDGKRPTGYQFFVNGKLSAVARDYQYDGLTCYYFVDSYNQDGELTSTSMYEVEYLE